MQACRSGDVSTVQVAVEQSYDAVNLLSEGGVSLLVHTIIGAGRCRSILCRRTRRMLYYDYVHGRPVSVYTCQLVGNAQSQRSMMIDMIIQKRISLCPGVALSKGL